MITVYGSDHCPDCRNFELNLRTNEIPYTYVNITDSMPNLKRFLRLRDHEQIFEPARRAGYVGIPCIVESSGAMTLDWEAWLRGRGVAQILHEDDAAEGAACSLDGTSR